MEADEGCQGWSQGQAGEEGVDPAHGRMMGRVGIEDGSRPMVRGVVALTGRWLSFQCHTWEMRGEREIRFEYLSRMVG